MPMRFHRMGWPAAAPLAIQARSASLYRAPEMPVAPPPPSGTVYYVDAIGGLDSNNGTSPATAWQTWAKAVTQMALLTAGQAILFKGGQTWAVAAKTVLTPAGTALNPITIGSYGTGKATFTSSVDNDYTLVLGNSGQVVRDIIFDGQDHANNAAAIGVAPSLNTATSNFWVWNNEVKRFGGGGIWVATSSTNVNAKISNVTIYGNHVHDFPDRGLTYGDGINLAAANVAAYSSGFAGTKNNSNIAIDSNIVERVPGSAIALFQTDGFSIRRNIVDACCFGTATAPTPVGIWCSSAYNGVIELNESHHNVTAGEVDGGGFDVDGDCQSVVVQHNYSHDNDGPGFLVYAYSGASIQNVAVRYNISQNDGINSNILIYGGLHASTGAAAAPLVNVNIHNNVFYQNRATRACISLGNAGTGGTVRVVNNICYGANATAYLFYSNNATGKTVRRNCYFGTGQWQHNTTNYATYAAWRTASTFENFSGDTGLNVDPQLSAPGTLGTLNGYDAAAIRAAYRLAPGSPARNVGADIHSLYGVHPGFADALLEWFGASGSFNIGPDQP